jgi:hypothetical protein
MESTARVILPRSEATTTTNAADTASKAVPPPAAPSLPYEVEQPWYGQRRAFRIIVLLLVLNIVAVTSITWGPITARAWQEHRAAAKAAEANAKAGAAAAAATLSAAAAQAVAVKASLGFQMPAGQVVYTEDPSEASRLLFSPAGGYSAIPQQSSSSLGLNVKLPAPPVLAVASAELRGAMKAFAPNPPEGTLFLHERTTPAGQSRIVWVHLVAAREMHISRDDAGRRYISLGSQRGLRAVVLSSSVPADGGYAKQLWGSEVSIEQPEPRRTEIPAQGESSDTSRPPHPARDGEVLRLLTGRPDPNDRARLLIDYTLDGKPGTFALTLQNDDRLRFEPDRGAVVIEEHDSRRGRATWKR